MYGPKSPRMWRSRAAYAVPPSSWDASTAVRIGRAAIWLPGIVTSLHDLPWSRDTWITPLVAPAQMTPGTRFDRSEEHTSELQSRPHLVCRLLLEKKKRSIGLVSATVYKR